MSAVFRTPDERFAGLPDFPWAPQYEEVGGLRLARIDEGAGATPVVLFHGEPTWSFLWRKVIPPLLDAGHRCVAPDLAGFGRSDKPTDLGWYSYDRHVDLMAELLFERLDIHDATFVVHDWGGPIGLRLAVEHPERVARIVLMDTGLFTGRQRMTDAWRAFRDFVERTEDLPVGFLVDGGCKSELPPAVVAAYEAPFPTPASKAGTRSFPLMLPTTPQDPGADAGQRTYEALQDDSRPKLVLWADGDPIIPIETGRKLAEALGAPEPEPIPGASHFLQEDNGETVGRRIAEWLGAQAEA